jgi:hypothetical protein
MHPSIILKGAVEASSPYPSSSSQQGVDIAIEDSWTSTISSGTAQGVIVLQDQGDECRHVSPNRRPWNLLTLERATSDQGHLLGTKDLYTHPMISLV